MALKDFASWGSHAPTSACTKGSCKAGSCVGSKKVSACSGNVKRTACSSCGSSSCGSKRKR